MRKIQTAQDLEKKRKRNNLILAIVMVALIGLSSLGYAIMSRDDTSSTEEKVAIYGGLRFEKTNTGYWATEINGQLFYFNYLPNEVENISIEGNYSFSEYYQTPVYIINSNPAIVLLNYAMENIALRIQEACLSGEKCQNPELPTKTCEDNLIVFRNANSNLTKVSREKNCVFIEGNFFEGTDRLVYKMLNIA
jgi:hypothetical protein